MDWEETGSLGGAREEVACPLTCKHAYFETVTLKTSPLTYTPSQCCDAAGTAPFHPVLFVSGLLENGLRICTGPLSAGSDGQDSTGHSSDGLDMRAWKDRRQTCLQP